MHELSQESPGRRNEEEPVDRRKGVRDAERTFRRSRAGRESNPQPTQQPLVDFYKGELDDLTFTLG